MKKDSVSSFNQYILGGTNADLFLASVFFAMIGIVVVLLLGTKLRDPNSEGSPRKFSFAYLVSDNARRIYGNILCVLVTLRFMPEILNLELKPWYGFVVGTFWDGLFLIIKQTTTLLDPGKKKP